EVQKRSPVIVNFSTGGFNHGCDTDEQKRAHLEHVWKVRPEVAALNMGSMNYAKYSEKRKQFVFDMVFINSFTDILICAEAMKEGGVKPPLQYSFVLGVMGGATPTHETLAHMAKQVNPDDQWEIIGISKVQWSLVASALVLGGNIRVGLEDNFYLDTAGTQMAKGNAPLVEKAVRMARDIGREPMTVDEARAHLRLPQAW